MKIAIMQPYIFPYIGYFQLINAVNTFVILDDVNFIIRGWINRNNILLNEKAHLFSISLDKPSQNKLICDTKLKFPQNDRVKFLKTIQLAYKKAPYFAAFFPIFENIILYENDDLTNYIHNSFTKICEYLWIKTHVIKSSQIKKDHSLKAENRIIEICKKLNATVYINPPGGRALYNSEDFAKENIQLKFINTLFDKITYKQYNHSFIANLSFLDAIMFNSKEEIKHLLTQYTLLA